MYCDKCGATYDDTAAFCPNCGQPNAMAQAGADQLFQNQPYQDPAAQPYQDPAAQPYQDPAAQPYQDPGFQNQPYPNQTFQNQPSQAPAYPNNQQAYAPGYQQPYVQPVQKASNGMSVAALVCGILGIVGGFIPIVMYFTLVLSILGIVFGVKGMKKSKETGTGHGLAVAGLVCGIIGAAFSGVGVICALACAGAGASALSGIGAW